MTPKSTVTILDGKDIWDISELSRKITPKDAADLLKLNTDNRSQRKGNIERIKRDIKNGQYLLNGDTIVISTENVLLNGQHRLEAIAAGTTAVDVVILTGVVPEAFATIDNHRPRSLSDYFKIYGEHDHSRVAQLVSRAERWDNGAHGSDLAAGSKRKTDQEYLDYFENNKDSILGALRKPQSYPRISPAITSIFRYIIGEEHKDACDAYLREVSTGVPTNPTDKTTVRVSKLKDAIITIHGSDNGRNKGHYLLGTLLVGWNKTQEGKTVTKKPFEGGDLPEPIYG